MSCSNGLSRGRPGLEELSDGATVDAEVRSRDEHLSPGENRLRAILLVVPLPRSPMEKQKSTMI